MYRAALNSLNVMNMKICALLKNFDYKLLDAQFITDHLKRFGAYEMPQSEYKHMLSLWAHEDRPFPTEYDPAWLDTFLNAKN